MGTDRPSSQLETDPLAGAELVAFAACARAGSVHGAADALHLTQSAVTKRVQRLERQLGLQLLARSAHGVGLTPAGAALLPAAGAALRALTAVRVAAAEHTDRAGQQLAVAASHTVGDYLLPDWLARFGREHPAVRTKVEIVNSPAVLQSVRAGAVVIGFVEGTDDLAGLEAIVVAEDEIAVVFDRSHRWAGRSSIAPAESSAEAYVTREAGSGTRAVAETALQAVGIRLTPALEVDSTQAVKRALAGGGFTLLSRVVVQAEIAAGRLLAVPVRGVAMSRKLRACRRAHTDLEGAAQELWSWLATLTAATPAA